jgi:hypothetical protein
MCRYHHLGVVFGWVVARRHITNVYGTNISRYYRLYRLEWALPNFEQIFVVTWFCCNLGITLCHFVKQNTPENTLN